MGAFVDAARAVPPATWNTPATSGKWSPAQLTEHVSIAYEVSRGMIHGQFTGRPFPRLLRPVVRTLFVRQVLRRGRFKSGSQSPGVLRPTASPGSREQLTARLQAAASAFEADLAAAAQSGRTLVDHPFFGRLPLADFLRFQMIHTRHHHQQLPGASP